MQAGERANHNRCAMARKSVSFVGYWASQVCRACSFPFPHRPAHTVAQWFQVGIINRRLLDRLLVNGHRLFEPLQALLQPAKLAAVAGEIVGNGPYLAELLRRGQQLVERFLGALQFVQRERAVNPGVRPTRGELDDRCCNSQPAQKWSRLWFDPSFGLDKATNEASRFLSRHRQSGLSPDRLNEMFHAEHFERIIKNFEAGKFQFLTDSDVAAMKKLVEQLR